MKQSEWAENLAILMDKGYKLGYIPANTIVKIEAIVAESLTKQEEVQEEIIADNCIEIPHEEKKIFLNGVDTGYTIELFDAMWKGWMHCAAKKLWAEGVISTEVFHQRGGTPSHEHKGHIEGDIIYLEKNI
jgi:hypothetical protein